jgi:hypothetical protein
VADIALSEREIVYEIDGITMVDRVHRPDVRRAMLLHSVHQFFEPAKFCTDRCPVDVPVAR